MEGLDEINVGQKGKEVADYLNGNMQKIYFSKRQLFWYQLVLPKKVIPKELKLYLGRITNKNTHRSFLFMIFNMSDWLTLNGMLNGDKEQFEQ